MGATPVLEVAVIGAGMIVHDQLLPSLYHLQRLGQIGQISIAGTRASSLRALRDAPALARGFPGQSFTALPGFDATEPDPQAYKALLRALPPRQLVIIALPDQLHFEVTMAALEHDQHVCCVKPLTLTHREGQAIAQVAAARGLLVAVEYHKRFDRRALIARRRCRDGQFGQFVAGEARLIEPWYYRESNFQQWFTVDQADPFVYVGCHYTDQVTFLTGLLPVEVSVAGLRNRFPNGKEGFMWSSGRVRFENGGLLHVLNGLGYPDDGAGSNDQGISLFFEGEGRGGCLRHNDQFRGIEHGFATGTGKGFNYINPDYFQYVPWDGPGLAPVGYGYDSVAAIVGVACRVTSATAGLDDFAALAERRKLLTELDAAGLIATAANSAYNELVMEAARLSILNDGDRVAIRYGDHPGVELVQRA